MEVPSAPGQRRQQRARGTLLPARRRGGTLADEPPVGRGDGPVGCVEGERGEHDACELGRPREQGVEDHERIEPLQRGAQAPGAGDGEQGILRVDEERADLAALDRLHHPPEIVPALPGVHPHVGDPDHVRLGRQVVQRGARLRAAHGDGEAGAGRRPGGGLSRRAVHGDGRRREEHGEPAPGLLRVARRGAHDLDGALELRALGLRGGVGESGDRVRGGQLAGGGACERAHGRRLAARGRPHPRLGERHELAPPRRHGDQRRLPLHDGVLDAEGRDLVRLLEIAGDGDDGGGALDIGQARREPPRRRRPRRRPPPPRGARRRARSRRGASRSPRAPGAPARAPPRSWRGGIRAPRSLPRRARPRRARGTPPPRGAPPRRRRAAALRRAAPASGSGDRDRGRRRSRSARARRSGRATPG